MKVYGILKDYTPVRQDDSRYVISYGIEQVDETHYTWYEIIFYKKQHPSLTSQEIKDAVCEDINKQTDEKIVSGFKWHNQGIWLSMENQFNFKAAYDFAIQNNGANLPITFKLGEDEYQNPVYYTFETVEEFSDFYTSAMLYVQQCLSEGWERKDAIDWSKYQPIEEQENIAS